MKKIVLTVFAMLLSAMAYVASAQYAYPQYASADEYRPLGANEAVMLTDDDVAALDAAGAIDWSKGDLTLKGTHLAQYQTVVNKKGKEVEKKVKFSKEEQEAILSNVGGIDFNPLWKKSAVMQTTGMWMLIGGSLFLVGGTAAGGGMMLVGAVIMPVVVAIVAVFTFGQADMTDVMAQFWDSIMEKSKIGGSVAVAGTAVAVTGAILLAVGHKNLRRTVKYTNAIGKPQQADLTFGATSSGVGLTLKF